MLKNIQLNVCIAVSYSKLKLICLGVAVSIVFTSFASWSQPSEGHTNVSNELLKKSLLDDCSTDPSPHWIYIKSEGSVVIQFYRAIYNPSLAHDQIQLNGYDGGWEKYWGPDSWTTWIRKIGTWVGVINDRIECLVFPNTTGLLSAASVQSHDDYYIHYCPLPVPSPLPFCVAFRGSQSERFEVMRVTVKHTTADDESGLGVCMGQAFGSIDWLLLLQFFEHYQLQGASHFYVCRKPDTDNRTNRIFDYYKNAGLLTVFPFETINLCDPETDTEDPDYVCQRTCINICMQEAIGRFKYMANIDVDELLHVNNGTLLEYFSQADSKNIGSFHFRMQMFLREYSSVRSVESLGELQNELPALKNTIATSVAPRGFLSKSVAKPRMIKAMGTHVVERYWSSSSETHYVEPSDGFVRHYRKTSHKTEWFEEQKKWWGYVARENEDPFNDKYSKQLAKRVYKVIERLKISGTVPDKAN